MSFDQQLHHRDIENSYMSFDQQLHAFLIVTEQCVVNNDIVLQPDVEVVKPCGGRDNDLRLKALESQIAELKSLILLNEGDSLHKPKNRWARGDSNARPSPCKGDVITS